MCIASGTNASCQPSIAPYPAALGLRRNAISMFSAESPPLPKLASAPAISVPSGVFHRNGMRKCAEPVASPA